MGCAQIRGGRLLISCDFKSSRGRASQNQRPKRANGKRTKGRGRTDLVQECHWSVSISIVFSSLLEDEIGTGLSSCVVPAMVLRTSYAETQREVGGTVEARRLDSLSYVKLYSCTANEVPHSQKSTGNVMGMGFAGQVGQFIRNQDMHVSGGKGMLFNVLGPRCKLASQTTARTLERFESGLLLCLLWQSFTLRESELGGWEARSDLYNDLLFSSIGIGRGAVTPGGIHRPRPVSYEN